MEDAGTSRAEARPTAVDMTSIAVNARFYAHRPTGMQRYALELAQRFADWIEPVRPDRALRGAAGHAWEQLRLPTLVRGRLLWSPNNTGPLAVERQVCTIHDLIPLDRPEWFNQRFAAWYEWLLPRLAQKVRHIITVSEFSKQRIVERLRVEPEKVSVILNGVDERFRPQTEQTIQEVREALGIPKGAYFLYVGSLEPRKNLTRLLEAWAQVQPAVDAEITLVVAGARGSARVFRKAPLSKVPRRVHRTGYVPEEQLPGLYAGALALLYPSLYEGFGLPPLEAMACGIPVVTSSTTSLPEVTGDAAILVDPESVESIAAGIHRVLSSEALRQELRARGLARAREVTWERTATETIQVLREQAEG